jgi:hypothetical protein
MLEEPRAVGFSGTVDRGHKPPRRNHVQAPGGVDPAAVKKNVSVATPAAFAEIKVQAKSPNSESDFPLASILGLFFIGAALLVRRVRLSENSLRRR